MERQNKRYSALLISVIVLTAFLLTQSITVLAGTPEKPTKLSPGELSQLLADAGGEVYHGGLMISSGETLAGPVIVLEGNLDIQNGGQLAGDAWIVGGNIILTGRAGVTGQVHLVNGRDYLSFRADVVGGIDYYHCACSFEAEQFEEDGQLAFVKVDDPLAVKTEFKLGLTEGNRVDPNAVHVGLQRGNPRQKKPHVSGHARLLFPIRNNTRGYLGFDIDLKIPVKDKKIDLLLHGYKKTWSIDEWQLPSSENGYGFGLTAIDYFDYHERQGGTAGVVWRPGDALQLKTLVSFHRELSLDTKSASSWFYPKRPHRSNPAIDEGERLAVTTTAILDTRYEENRPGSAWYLEGSVEKGIADGPGDFSYASLTLDVRRYNQILPGLQFDSRARLFTAYDRLPRQLTQSLNGYAGVRGAPDFPYGDMRGDRLALISNELRIGLPQVPVFSFFFSRWDLVMFSDMGLLTRSTNEQAPLAFLDTSLRDWKKTVGFGISGESFLPYLGIYVAQDLDRQQRRPRIIVRASRSF